MSKSKGLQLAIELAEQRRDAFRKRLSFVQRHHLATLGQLEQLRSYATEKDLNWTSPTDGVFSGEILKHHYQFMGRLQEAMTMQSEVVLAADKQVKEVQLRLAEAETHLEVLKRIWQMRVSETRQVASKQEQKQTDEFALQRYLHRTAQTQGGVHV